MKKILMILLIACLALSFFSCSDEEEDEGYAPIASTAEEARTVLTLSADGFSYNIPYELYRAFFLNCKSTVDGGDSSVWSGPDSQTYIAKAEEIIFESVCDIYSVFHLCNKVGIDIYSSSVEESINEYITASVEGGSVDGMLFQGYAGNYSAYLESLKKLNMNYSAQVLLFRYAIASEMLDEYYTDKTNGTDAISFTKEDVEAFYFSDECVRVISRFFNLSTDLDKEINTTERINKIRNGMIERIGDENALCSYLISTSIESEDIRGGLIIAKHNLDPTLFKDLTNAAFDLEMHEVSLPINPDSASVSGCYLLYRTDKSYSHFEEYYSSVEDAYVQNLIGSKLNSAKLDLLSSLKHTGVMAEYDYSKISMG